MVSSSVGKFRYRRLVLLVGFLGLAIFAVGCMSDPPTEFTYKKCLSDALLRIAAVDSKTGMTDFFGLGFRIELLHAGGIEEGSLPRSELCALKIQDPRPYQTQLRKCRPPRQAEAIHALAVELGQRYAAADKDIRQWCDEASGAKSLVSIVAELEPTLDIYGTLLEYLKE